MLGREWARLLAVSICTAVACGDGGSSEADAGMPGAECFDDYVLFEMGVINPDAGFVEIDNGDDLAVTASSRSARTRSSRSGTRDPRRERCSGC